jgi:hypothetical protein
MGARWGFHRRHPVLAAATGAATTASLVALLFLAGGASPSAGGGKPYVAQLLVTPEPVLTKLTVQIVPGTFHVSTTDAGGVLQATLLSGTLPATPVVARLIADEPDSTDASGIVHCVHVFLLPDGSVIRVLHAHPASVDRCPEIGDAVALEPVRL